MGTQLYAALLSFHTIQILATPSPAQKLREKNPNGWKHYKMIIFHNFELSSLATSLIKQNKNNWA